MKIKTNLIRLIIIVSLTTIVASCESHGQKTGAAFEAVKEKRLITNDSDSVNKAMIQEPIKNKDEKQNPIPDDRTVYMLETEKRIRSNKNKINEIKNHPIAYTNSRKVNSLENDNNNLIIKLDEYNKDEKLKWELFKADMNQHVNEISIELKEIKINNRK
ncbi:MAG: hypothetical protein PHS84_13635 [Paludibacter sp.]|nr:hypothetical protein [Paludibacter sp.]